MLALQPANVGPGFRGAADFAHGHFLIFPKAVPVHSKLQEPEKIRAMLEKCSSIYDRVAQEPGVAGKAAGVEDMSPGPAAEYHLDFGSIAW